MKKILLIGYYGHGNFGDDLILETLVSELSAKFCVSAVDYGYHRNCEIVEYEQLGMVNRRYVYTERRKLLSKINVLLQPLQIIKYGIRQDIVAFGGGTQLFETKKNGFLPLICDAFHVLVLKYIFNVRVVHFFVGVNKPRSKTGDFLLRLIIRNSDFLILRDKQSYDLCTRINPFRERVFLAHDSVYLRDDIPTRAFDEAQDKITIGISIFPYFTKVEDDAMQDARYLDYVHTTVQQITKGSEKKVRIVFFGSQAVGDLSDMAYARSLSSRFTEYCVEYVDYRESTKLYLNSLSEMDVVIAMRLHVLISAALVGVTKIVALPYQTKVVEEALDLGVSIMNYSDLSTGLFPLRSTEVAAKRKTINKRALDACMRALGAV